MPPFQRVDQQRAGATAIGILVPPGQRTTVIVRPRGLKWDLLPVRIEQGVRSTFCQFSRDEAAGVARQLQRDLATSAARRCDPLVMLSQPTSGHIEVGVRGGDFYWIVCARTPGNSYQPLTFSAESEAHEIVQLLGTFLYPAAEANQEVYFNTQHFK